MADDLFFVSSKCIIMATEKSEKNNQDASNKDAAVKPDPETLNTTDPQEHMEGPFSSLMKGASDTFEEEGGKKNSDD